MTPRAETARVVSVSVTEAGRRLAARLPFAHAHGDAAATVRARWAEVDALVLFLATGAAVRLVAPLLADKASDPAVVCVDETGRFAVALTGGHRGANRLARQVAGLLGAEAVVTTATDAAGVPALDLLGGFRADGDVAGVTRALLDGETVVLDDQVGWPLPGPLAGRLAVDGPPGAPRLLIDDRTGPGPGPGVARLVPPSLVVGVGTSTDAPPDELAALVAGVLERAGLDPAAVAEVATVDRRRSEPAVVGLGWPVTAFAPGELAEVAVPTPSPVVQAAVGTPSVAEAACLRAAGPGAELVVAKHKAAHATVAVARRAGPAGRLAVVGLGPGGPASRTPEAAAAVADADLVVGYGPYVDQAADLLGPHQERIDSALGQEMERARLALEAAAAGRRVALVCSGDAGVYAMASPVLELAAAARYAAVAVSVVPGVTAGLAAAAVLGAPLGHDHAMISLSDLLTPWEVIERRLEAAGAGDFVVVLYNPRSARRRWQLERARTVLLGHRDPVTPVGLVTDAGRPGQRAVVDTLAGFDASAVTMTTCVVVGSSQTMVRHGRMVTARGYRR